ncbi:small terminase subunit [Delftia tsuruhatensis]|nr:small terminase subunit [Delftia tsuruhatensis]
MGRRSSVSRLEPEARKHLELLIRQDRHTLDELLKAMRDKFPEAGVSRSSIYRFQVPFKEMLDRMRDQQAMAGVLVQELGENPDDKAGALMVQAITTLTTQSALMEAGAEQVDIEAVRKLARAAKDVLQARKVDRQERIAIRKAARDELLAEQQANLEKIAKAQGMGQEQLDFWLKDFLGVR